VLGAAVALLRRCTPSPELNDFPLELGLHYLAVDDCCDTDGCWEAITELLGVVTRAQAKLLPQNRPSCPKDVNAANFQMKTAEVQMQKAHATAPPLPSVCCDGN
jgi:hypothetical protein